MVCCSTIPEMYHIFPFMREKSQPRCDLEATLPRDAVNSQKGSLPVDASHWPVAIVPTLDQSRNDLMRSGAAPKTPVVARTTSVGIRSIAVLEERLDIKVGLGRNAKRWKIHKDLLCSQSHYFTTACNSSFRES